MIQLMWKSPAFPREMKPTIQYVAMNYITEAISSMFQERISDIVTKPNPPFIGAGFGYDDFLVAKTMDCFYGGVQFKDNGEKEAVQALIDGGADLISQHADSMGAPTACETAGVPNVSYNGSTASVAPNTFIVSSRINWVPYMTLLIDSVLNGKEIPADFTGTIADGSVELTALGDAAAEGTQEAIDAAKAEIVAGNLHVFDTTTFTVGGETLTSFLADVDSDTNYEHETEVIENGYIAESKFRSAPYFDLEIDGITLLDRVY